MMKYILAAVLTVFSMVSFAATDIQSTIERVQLKGDGNLWIKMTNSGFDRFCKPGWHGFNLFIPQSDAAFPYYYGLVTSALAKGQDLYIANIDVFDGSTHCDLTKTGYGIVVQK